MAHHIVLTVAVVCLVLAVYFLIAGGPALAALLIGIVAFLVAGALGGPQPRI